MRGVSHQAVPLAVFLALLADRALADPCTAPLPHRAGATFSGTVRYVGDGDGLCVGTSPDPATWVEVRLGDFDAPELHSPEGPAAKRALERIAFGRPATCTVVRGRTGRTTSHDRVIAVCRVNGLALGDQLRGAGVQEGGN
jgi:endonuclease YncB( thermonuclease family)